MEPKHIIEAHSSHVNSVLFSQDGTSLFSFGFSGELRQWSTNDWSLIRDLEGHTKSVNCGIEINGQLISGALDGNINFYDILTGALQQSVSDHKKGVGSIRKPVGDSHILSSGPDRMAVVRGPDGAVQAELKPTSKNIGVMSTTMDGQHVLVGGLGNLIQVFSIPSLEKVAEVEVGSVALTCVRMNPDGKTAWVMDYTSTLSIVDVSTWTVLESHNLNKKGAFSMAYLPSRNELAVVCADGVVLLDAASYEEKGLLKSSAKGNYTISVSGDEKLLALASADKRVRIWELN